jgi:hypothetical protein
MTFPALIPATFKGDARRRTPPISQNQKVPLWTAEPDGQQFQGVIRVPLRLCNSEEHTNARHEFDKLVRENLARWVEWRRRRGWFITDAPKVSGPWDPPAGDRVKSKSFYKQAVKTIGRNGSAQEVTTFDYGEELKWYIADARFSREEPLYVRLEDMLFFRHLALQYGVDPDRDPGLENELPEGKDVIEVDGGLDPLVVAEERRQSMGLKRKDYLMGRLQDPL